MSEFASWLGAVGMVSALLAGVCALSFRVWPGAPVALRVWGWRLVFVGALAGPTVHGMVAAPVVAPSRPGDAVDAAGGLLPGSPLAAPRSQPAVLTQASPGLGGWLGGLGLLAGGLGLLRWHRQRRGTGRIARTGRGSPPAVVAAVRDLAQTARLRRAPRVRTVPSLASPAVWGVFHPVVAVPAAVESAPASLVQGMMAHEVAHLRHGDPGWSAFVHFVRAVVWWNPVFALAGRALLRAVEERADDTAGLWVGRRTVAQGLVRAAEWLREGDHARVGPATTLGVPSLGMAGGGGLSERVDRLLSARPRKSRVARWVAVPALTIGGLASIAGATVLVPAPAWGWGAPSRDAWSAALGGAMVGEQGFQQALESLSRERAALQETVQRLAQLMADEPATTHAEDRVVLARVADRLQTLAAREATLREWFDSSDSDSTPPIDAAPRDF